MTVCGGCRKDVWATADPDGGQRQEWLAAKRGVGEIATPLDGLAVPVKNQHV